MNSKIVLDRRQDRNGQPVVMVYGIIVGKDFGIEDGKRRIVAANATILPLPGRRYVEPENDNLGSPEDILEHHLNFEHWVHEEDA